MRGDGAVNLNALLSERILILDGAAGTWLQDRGLCEEDYRGKRFAHHPTDLFGNHEMLNLVKPDIIREFHLEFLRAGADIIETNTFNGTRISQAEYGTGTLVYDLNLKGAQIARTAVESFLSDGGRGPRFIAGALGPTSKTLSLSPRVEDPGYRELTFDQMATAYGEAALGLIEGGVDIFLIETITDALNAKAALYALFELFDRYKRQWPIMISATIPDASGRTLTGDRKSVV